MAKKRMDSGNIYSKHLDVLTALITYLALTDKKSRTPRPLAADLSLPADAVEEVLNTFPGIFRKSQNTDANGNHFYTVHARYATRTSDERNPQDADLPAIRPELLRVLLEFAVGNARSEQAKNHLDAQLDAARRNANTAAIVAGVAACISLIGVILTIVLGH